MIRLKGSRQSLDSDSNSAKRHFLWCSHNTKWVWKLFERFISHNRTMTSHSGEFFSTLDKGRLPTSWRDVEKNLLVYTPYRWNKLIKIEFVAHEKIHLKKVGFIFLSQFVISICFLSFIRSFSISISQTKSLSVKMLHREVKKQWLLEVIN